MLDLKIYEDIASFTAEGILVAKPVYSESETVATRKKGKTKKGTTDIIDFETIYLNQAYRTITEEHFTDGQVFSESMPFLSEGVEWITLAKDTFETKKPFEKRFFSKNLNVWLYVSFKRLPSDLLLVSLHDISKDTELEEQLRRQNLRLTALSDELVLSKQDLQNKLEKIQKLNESLEHLAFHDQLTGLPNRTCFHEGIEVVLAEAKKSNKKVALMFIDIDDLRDINDFLGYSIGDNIIKLTGNQLKEFENDGVQVFRFGGDEFLLVISEVRTHKAIGTVANAVFQALNQVNIFVSAGVSVYPDDAEDTDELLKYADMALHKVKTSGKKSCIFFEELMHQQLLERLQLEEKIAGALRQKKFQLYFQPQYDVNSKTLRGFEALLRWHDDELGWVSPDIFIPIAEDTKLIVPIGIWVVEKTLQTVEKWQKNHDFQGIVSINVSPVQLKDPDFIKQLEKLLKKYDVMPEKIEVEITEGVLIENTEEIIETLNAIKDLGLGISLDDFGMGYSSLNYLKDLPLTTLKIDKAFISNITTPNSVEAEITDSIVALVSKMGLNTIAEGVENIEQFEVLKKINCHTSQGFLTGRPMPEDECLELFN